jgi:VCBS repeat-containing protein
MTFNTIFKSSAIALILMSNYALAATAEPGAAPVVTSSAITTADEDSVYTYMMSATDSNVDDLLTWEVTDGESLPSWLSLSNGGATQATLVTGGLNGAKGVAVDDLGNVYITNVASAVNEFPSGIIKFDTDGIKTSFADDGAGEALEWHDGKLYMSYRTGNNGGTAGEIVSYDSDGSNKTVIISGLSEPIGMSFYNDFLFVGQVNGLIGVINPSDNNPVTNQSNYAILDDDLDCKNVAGIQFVGDEGDMLVVCDGTGASTAIFKIELASDAEGPFSGLNSGEVEEFFDLNSTSHQDIQVDKDGFYYVTNRNNVYRKSFLTNRHDFRDDNNEQFSAYGLAQNSSGTLFFANNFAGDLYAIQPGAQLTGTPTNDDVGDHPVALSVNDGTGNVVSHNFVITVANTNDAPIAESQETFAVYKSTPINITLTGTDEDPTNDVLSFSIHSSPSGGTFSQSGEHGEVITYTANEGFSGADSFEFVVNDTIVDSAPVAININVSLNLAPIVSGAQAEQSVTDTTTVTPFSNIELSDGEGDNIALTIDLDDYNNGTLSGTGLTGTGPYSLASDSTANVQAVLRALIFTPAANRVLPGTTETTTFTLVANDGTDDSAANNTATVVSTSVDNSAIISGDFTFSIIEDSGTSATGTMSISDIDAGQTPTFVSGDTVSTYGTLTLSVEGNWSYDLDNALPAVQALSDGATMTDIIIIFADDGTQMDITITITGVNGVAMITGTSAGAATEDNPTQVTGSLSIADEDTGEAVFVAQTNAAGSYGTFNLTISGNWTYDLDSTKAAVQALPNGATLTDSFTASSADSTDSQLVTITITGVNGVAMITGTSTGVATEDDATQITGSLAIVDEDTDEAVFVAQSNTAGSYGTFNLTTSGNWTYDLDSTKTAVQALPDGATLTDSFTASSADSTNSQVTITITGVNGVATITGTSTGAATEDDATQITGSLAIVDEDTGEAVFVAQSNAAGSYGTFNLATSGNWTYDLDSTSVIVHALIDGDTLTDSFTVASADSTDSQLVTITITGVNGEATITGTSTGAATEDDVTVVTGDLTVDDEDTAEAVFVMQTNSEGNYGFFSLTLSGTWSYQLDGSNLDVNVLPEGETLTDSFTVSSFDGTDSQVVTITITGINDVATITGTSTGAATEDNPTQITGSLAIADEDTGEAVFVAQSNTAGSYGTFNLTTSGNWTYDLDSTKTAVQALPNGATLTDSFTASSADSTDSQLVTITITGVNGVATITGTSTGAATEDDATQITGSLAIVDEDTGEAVFVAQSNAAGSYGTFNLATSGNWTYDLDSTSVIVHALIDGDTLTDSFTVASADSTDSQLVTITITGVNGEATITGTSTGAATEDDVTVVTGDLTVDDEDTAEAFFVMQTNSEGNYGFFSLTLSGTWSYQLDGSNLDVNVLPEGETLTDSFTVSSFDGTDSQVVTITITGINDAATITGTSIADTNEDNTALITGSLAITDNDTGEAIFMMQSGVAGAYGIFNIDNQGNWTFTLDNDNTEVQQMSSGEQLTDSFTVMSIDGTDSKIITVTVFGANDAPNAEPDEVTVDISVNGVYVIDVLVNDIDVDGDALSIVGANTSLGSVSINGENLTLTTQTGFVGQVELTYTITDGNNTFSKTTVDLLITGALSETAPVIIVPETVEVNAEGLYTKVDLGVATAINSQGQPVPISLVDGAPLFRPGNRIAYWQAIDPETGLTTVASQKVIIHPIISLGKDQVVVEGKKVSVDIILNGEAPKYPVVIALSISGSVDENDYAIQTQEVTIDSGTQTSVLIDIVQDNVIEGNETLIVSLVEGNISNRTTQVITIVESNIAPKVTLSSSQNAEERQLVTPTDGLVSIDAIVVDANDDNFSTQWLYDPALNINEVDEITLTLDPSGLNSGIYSIGIKVIDAGEGNLSTTQTLYLEVLASLAVLTDVDSDGDLIPDNEEGHGDSDQDGIPDYLDAIAECNVMPAQVAVQDGFLVEGDPGVCLRKGNTLAAGETGGLQLTDSDLESSIGIDENAIIVGGIFDYIATGLPQAGKNYQIVLPQIEPIPAGAVYRKYSTTTGWGNFFINVDNQLHSAAGDLGYCPPSGSTQWSTGLTEGHWCVQLTIEDGGLNDNDGLANGTIVDPGGVAVLLTSNTMPVAQADVVRVKRNESILIDALANDSDADGDALSIGVATAIFGEVTLTADNQLNYQSKADFIGLDTLVYTLSDGNGGSDSGTVSITVYLNDEPVALDDSAETDDRSAIIITVLDNDSDADGDSLTIVSATVDEGSVTINENNTLTYTPDNGFDGTATISYTIDDGQGDQAIAQVLVTVNAYQNAMVNNKSNGGSMGLMIISLIGVTLYRMRRKKKIGRNQLVQAAALLVATSMSLAAAEPQWFVTSSVGISDANSHVNIPSDIGITSSDLDKSSASYTIGGGVNYSVYSFTLSYEQLGDSSASYVGEVLDTALFHQTLVNNAPKLVEGISLQGQYTLWQDDALSASIGVGLFAWDLDYTSQLNDSVIKVSEDDIDLFYNLQIAYAITEQVQVSVKASRYSLVHDINNIALGLTYHF